VDQDHDVVALLNDLVDIQPVLVPGVEPGVPVPQSGLNAVKRHPVFVDGTPLHLRMERLAKRVIVVFERRQEPTNSLVTERDVHIDHRGGIIAAGQAATAKITDGT